MYEKVCPAPGCGAEFKTRWNRQVCCSKKCARRLEHEKRGNVGPTWKGGICKHASGYIKEMQKDHPAADAYGYVMQHRLVMERMLGRLLEPMERVHHKNGIRDDNRPENLELWYLTSRAKKDPPGQRFIDLLEHGLRRCPAEAVEKVRRDLRAAFGLKQRSNGHGLQDDSGAQRRRHERSHRG